MQLRFWILFFLFIGFFAAAQSPPAPWVQWTEKDGLPDNGVLAITSDLQNQLWIGTANGLSRFDGNSFKNYQYNPLDTNSLPADRVTSLLCDHTGRIWIGTSGGGLAYYQPETDDFIRLSDSILESRVILLTQDQHKNVIVGYRAISDGPGGITMIDTAGNISNKLVGTEDFAGFKMKVQYLIQDPHQTHVYWLGGRSFFRWDSQTGEVSEFPHPEMVPNYSVIYGLFPWTDSTLMVGNFYAGWMEFNKNRLEWEESIHRTAINNSTMSADGEILFCGNQGLGRIHPGSNEVSYLFHFENNTGGLPKGTNLYTVHEDNRKNVWIGTNKGIFCWNPQLSQFPTFEVNPTPSGPGNPVYVTSNETGSSVFRSLSGIHIVDDNFEEQKFIPHPGKEKDLYWFDIDNQDQVWLFSRHRIYTLDASWQNIIEVPLSPHQKAVLDSVRSYSAMVDSKDRIWIGTQNHGLIMLPYERDTLYHFRHDPNNPNSLCHDHYLFEIEEDDDGMIWIATDKGFSVLNPENLQFIAQPELVNKLKDQIIHCLEPDGLGNMWLGTRTQGLFRYDQKDQSWKQYTVASGLPFNGVNKMILKDSSLWLCTRRGLGKLNIHDFSIQNFDDRNGLVQNSLYTSRISKSPAGQIVLNYPFSPYFNIFQEEQLAPSNTPPHVFIRQLNLLSQEPIKHLTVRPESTFSLKAKDNYISIDFNGIHYLKQQSLELEYRLRGYDDTWLSAGNNRNAVFTNLPGGIYTFEVRGRIGLEKWSPTSNLSIFIATPWYKTWWFRLLTVLAIAAIILLIVRWQIRRIRLQGAIQQRLAETEMKALRAQINPHFIFNCLNSIKHFIIQKNVKEGVRHINGFSKLIRIVLNNSGERFITLQKELEALELYLQLEQMRFDQQFNFSVENELASVASELQVPPLLLQPYVENAIWHGIMPVGKGTVKIKIWGEQEMIRIRIIDDGIGVAASKAQKAKTPTGRKSLGVQLNARRIDVLNQYYDLAATIEIAKAFPDNPGRPGTQVDIQLPAISQPLNQQNHESSIN